MLSKNKLRKLINNPQKFFEDSKMLQKIFMDKEIVSTNVIKNESSLFRKEPLLMGHILVESKKVNLTLDKKKLKDVKNGFTNLCLIPPYNDYLVHTPIAGEILKNKEFIGFREKNIYFATYENKDQYIDFEDLSHLFMTTPALRSNLLDGFRNILIFNPKDIIFVVLRQTNPWIRSILIIDDEESLKEINGFEQYVDTLIVSDKLKEKVKLNYFKKYYLFNDNPLSAIKNAIVNNGYKTDNENILLPVINDEPNLEILDKFNELKCEGLLEIEMNYDSLLDNTFSQVIKHAKIKKMFLRENIYNLYKDKIFEIKKHPEKINDLLMLTVKEGVHYEKI